MCSLCGVLTGGRGHWTESASNPEVFGERSRTHTARRERQQRVRLTNRILQHYGLTLADWAGSSYILRSATGHTAILGAINEVWAAADKLRNMPGASVLDPLDPELLATLGGES